MLPGPVIGVHRGAVGRAVAEHRDRLRAAGRVHLGDPEQFAGGQHGRVRLPAVLGLRRRGHRDLADPGHLSRDHVHHDRRRIGDQAARHVHARPPDRQVALGDRAAVGDLGHGLGRDLSLMHPPGPVGRRAQRLGHRRIELGQRGRQHLARHDRAWPVDTVEPDRVLAHRRRAALAHVLAHRLDDLDGRGNIKFSARKNSRQPAAVQRGDRPAPQINPVKHQASLAVRSWAALIARRGLPATGMAQRFHIYVLYIPVLARHASIEKARFAPPLEAPVADQDQPEVPVSDDAKTSRRGLLKAGLIAGAAVGVGGWRASTATGPLPAPSTETCASQGRCPTRISRPGPTRSRRSSTSSC